MARRAGERAGALSIAGPVGRLEAVLEPPDELPDGDARGAAIVAHPHPLHGGTLANTIVFRTARALRAAGLATLRFNFRGVGASEGEFHGERGEEDDAKACLVELARRHPGVPLWAAGYSFGARTVCGLAARDASIERLVLVAMPVAYYDCDCVAAIEQPGLLLFGSDDGFGTAGELARRFPSLPSGLEVDEIEGADHFFRGRTPILEERVREYALRAWEEVR